MIKQWEKPLSIRYKIEAIEKMSQKGIVMKLKYKSQSMVISIIFVVGFVGDMHACITTITNDKMPKMMIYNKPDKTFIVMRRHEKRRLGSQHQRAHFALYIQQPNKPIFSRIYTCQQNACSKTGNIQLKFSDIENGSGDAYLFNITKNKPHSSMAKELPIMRKNCQSCRQE